jgi:hypothetical protein
MTLTTGMSMLGKMSTAVREIEKIPSSNMSIDITTNVYGRFSASLTIHIILPAV